MNNKNLTTDSIRQHLNHSTAQIDEDTIENLRRARTRALESYRMQQETPVLAWLSQHGLWIVSPSSSHRYTHWIAALLFLACMISGIAYLQQSNAEHDHSDIDIAILSDDLPVDAYVE